MLKVILILSLVVVASCVGGYGEVDVDDENVVAAANHAAKTLSKKFSSQYHHRLVKVIKARRQVVAGLNYQLDLIVGLTNCKKAEVAYEETEGCDFQDNISTFKKCTVVVYKDLQGKHQLISSGCILASQKDL